MSTRGKPAGTWGDVKTRELRYPEGPAAQAQFAAGCTSSPDRSRRMAARVRAARTAGLGACARPLLSSSLGRHDRWVSALPCPEPGCWSALSCPHRCCCGSRVGSTGWRGLASCRRVRFGGWVPAVSGVGAVRARGHGVTARAGGQACRQRCPRPALCWGEPSDSAYRACSQSRFKLLLLSAIYDSRSCLAVTRFWPDMVLAGSDVQKKRVSPRAGWVLGRLVLKGLRSCLLLLLHLVLPRICPRPAARCLAAVRFLRRLSLAVRPCCLQRMTWQHALLKNSAGDHVVHGISVNVISADLLPWYNI